MMTKILMTCFLTISTMSPLWSKNPMKMSTIMLLSSSIMFATLALKTSSTWPYMIFMLMFTGGILIMFMILSSLSPNEKSKKVKMSILIPTTLMLISFNESSEKMKMNTETKNTIKKIINSSLNLTIMITIIMSYFYTFLTMISKDNFSMRSNMC